MRKTSTKTLRFKNPFRTSGRKQQIYTTYRSPIQRTGLTSLEIEQRDRAIQKINDLKRAGLYDPANEDWFNVTFKDFGDTAMFPIDKDLPQGVTNVEAAEEMRSAMRQAQAQQAGILAAKDARMSSLLKIMKKRQMEQLKKKAIEYLAESDELDQVPEEYQEAVSNWYYNDIPARYRKYIDLESFGWVDPASLKTPEEREELKWIKQQYTEKDMDKLKNRLAAMVDVQDRRKKRRQREDKYATENLDRTAKDYYKQLRLQKMQNRRGGARFEGRSRNLFGWRAPYLFSLVKPIHPLGRMFAQTPEDRIKRAKEEMDDFRDGYREAQTEQRGIAPPKEMVNRAFPKFAAPLLDFEKKNPTEYDYTENTMIAHPFIFPKRNFFVRTF